MRAIVATGLHTFEVMDLTPARVGERDVSAAVDASAMCASELYGLEVDLGLQDFPTPTPPIAARPSSWAVQLGNAVGLRCLRVFADQSVEDLSAADPRRGEDDDWRRTGISTSLAPSSRASWDNICST